MKYFSKEHEWVEQTGDDSATVGITEYAANELGDITYVELPKEGSDLIVGDVVGVVESVKAASDIYCPISGTVSEVNSALEDEPGMINNSPLVEGWIFKLDNVDPDEFEDMMNEEAYQAYIDSL